MSYEQDLKEREKRERYLEGIVGASVAQVEESVISEIRGRFHHSTFFGATGIDPAHLAIWYFLNLDVDLAEAKFAGLTDGIDSATRSALRENGYPQQAISKIRVMFSTDEDVQRETGGNYWHYLK